MAIALKVRSQFFLGQVPSPLLIEDLELLEEDTNHSPALTSSDTTGDGAKVRTLSVIRHLCLEPYLEISFPLLLGNVAIQS